MSRKNRYRFNEETLNCEIHKTPLSAKFLKSSLYFLASFGMFVLYLYLYTTIFGFETPKTKILKKESAEWHSKLEDINVRFGECSSILSELQLRDNAVYRPIFGMEEISSDVRNAGFGGTDRYSHLSMVDYSGFLTSTAMTMDILYKKAYIQSRSLDDVSLLSKRTGEMAQCIPTISPVTTAPTIRFSSKYGMRIDPKNKVWKMHHGIDLSGPSGEPIYATGNGEVSRIGYDFFGYGNFIVIDHGFGYKTRYGHLKGVLVSVGQKVKRGEQIGEMGNTGRSFGTHLHYEVIYKNSTVNPVNYYNSEISPEDYALLVNEKAKI